MSTLPLDLARRERRKPTWEMALIYPDQGGWTKSEYLRLDIGRHVDYDDGFLEFQPMPNEEHQAILFFLIHALKTYAARHGGKAHMAPFPVRLWNEKFREPDAVFMSKRHVARCKGEYWEGADLVMEIVSESNRKHDLETKRAEYAQAGIPEYWLVDPNRQTITVLKLKGRKYAEHAEYKKGSRAVSASLPGFEVDVRAALDAN